MPATRWRDHVSDALRTRLWPVPLIGVLLAIAAGIFLPSLDHVIGTWLAPIRSVFASSPDDARELLGTISTALVTVTSLTFSLTVVTLQLASGQYSPRLLRTFARDRFVQRTLALFLATFAYSLTALQNVHTTDVGKPGEIPQISVSVAVFLALLSVIGLVFFLAHLVTEIRVETMMHTVWADSISAARQIFEAADSADEEARTPQPPDNAELIDARSTGFLVSIDEQSLMAAAAQADAVVLVNRAPGDWLICGEPLAYVWGCDPRAPLDRQRLEMLAGAVAAAVRTGNERTPVQDVGYGLRQLTDVAVKALSPGINDPTTAVHALGYSSALLCDLAQRRLDYKTLRCGEGTEVVIRQPTFSELLDLAIAQPRRYGAKDPALLARIFTLLREVARQATHAEHRHAISGQLERLRRTMFDQDFDEAESVFLAHLGRDVEDMLAGTWRPPVGERH